MEKLTIILVVLGATWAGMFHVIKTVEIKNAKRDIILNISLEGRELNRRQKEILLNQDYIPIWNGIRFFLVMIGVSFASLPFVVEGGGRDLHYAEWAVCTFAVLFAAYALYVETTAGWVEVKEMKDHIESNYPLVETPEL